MSKQVNYLFRVSQKDAKTGLTHEVEFRLSTSSSHPVSAVTTYFSRQFRKWFDMNRSLGALGMKLSIPVNLCLSVEGEVIIDTSKMLNDTPVLKNMGGVMTKISGFKFGTQNHQQATFFRNVEILIDGHTEMITQSIRRSDTLGKLAAELSLN